MKYVIAYDVDDDAVRERVADVLGTCGWRVQRSVFECSVESDELPALWQRDCARTSQGGDRNVRIYRVCRDLEAEMLGIGGVSEPPDVGPSLVL